MSTDTKPADSGERIPAGALYEPAGLLALIVAAVAGAMHVFLRKLFHRKA